MYGHGPLVRTGAVIQLVVRDDADQRARDRVLRQDLG